VNVAVAVHTSLSEKLVFLRRGAPSKAVLQGISLGAVAETDIVTSLAELGRLAGEEVVMIAPMRLVTGRTVLRNRRVLKSEGSSLLLMTGVAKLRNGIGPEHLLAKSPVGRVTIRALHLALDNRVVGLSVYLTSYVSMAREAKVGLTRFQVISVVRVAAVAVGARDTSRLVCTHIPRVEGFGITVTT
jgi:hypothetical protein